MKGIVFDLENGATCRIVERGTRFEITVSGPQGTTSGLLTVQQSISVRLALGALKVKLPELPA